MKPGKPFTATAVVSAASAVLVALIWYGAAHRIHNQWQDIRTRTEATLSGQALLLAKHVGLHVTTAGQTLNGLIAAWTINPADFDLSVWCDQIVKPNGISRDAVMTDERGIIRQSSIAGAITPVPAHPGTGIADQPLFAAIKAAASGVWVGPAPIDAVTRIHAFSRLPGQVLAVVVVMDKPDAMRPAAVQRTPVVVAAGCITALLVLNALLLIRIAGAARGRAAQLAATRAELAAMTAERDGANADAREKAELLMAALDGLQDGLAIFDAQTCLVAWNQHFAEVASFPREMLRVGLPIADILLVQARDGQFGSIDSPEAEVSRRMARIWSGPYGVVQRLRPDGHTIEIRRKDLLNGGTIVVYADITGQKQGEAALREARQAADASARLVSMILAETDAPLARMTAELADIPDHALGPAARLPLTAVRQSADLVRQVLDDMAGLERIRSGGPMRPGFFDIGAVIEDSVARVRHRASERGIAITAGQRGAAPTTMHADEQRLRRLLLIMLNNAISHSPPGEIAIAAEPGQAADRAARILVKWRSRAVVEAGRVHNTAVHRDAPDGWPGSELGFAICQELAGLMGGRIVGEASTTPDGVAEATIWFELPASGGPAPPEGAAGASPGSPDDQTSIPGFGPMGASRRPLPRTRILLVEDVVASQIVTATLLRRDGHMVDIAGSGEAALMAAEKCPYDLVFMDISMPGMDGLTATAAIRALPEPVRAVPVIALTADVSPLDSAALDAAGMNGVLGKPIVLDELLEAVAKHVWSRGPANGQSASGSSPPPSGLVPRVGPATPLIPARPVLAAERILELRGHLPPATFVSLVEECLVDLDQRLPALRQAFATGSVSGITAHAHAMVGMAGGYGMASLEARLRAIVTAARTGDTAALGPSAVPEVEAELAAATRALRELMQDVLT